MKIVDRATIDAALVALANRMDSDFPRGRHFASACRIENLRGEGGVNWTAAIRMEADGASQRRIRTELDRLQRLMPRVNVADFDAE